jgi:YD repeat-containing protein
MKYFHASFHYRHQQEFLAIKNVYGSSAVQKNIGRIYQIYDQSGLTEFSAYDFKGNPLQQKKKFCQSYNTPVNWGSTPLLQDEVFTTSWSYNALNQPLLMTLPDGSSQQNTYNKAGLLETVSSNGQAYVTNINYNEKGQRSDIHYGNGSKTRYEYDKNTFRLIRLLTTRNNGNDILQDIHYTHDPVGNIVEIVDNAQQNHYFSNSVIEPRAMYKYDALYRLTEATGRELASL